MLEYLFYFLLIYVILKNVYRILNFFMIATSGESLWRIDPCQHHAPFPTTTTTFTKENDLLCSKIEQGQQLAAFFEWMFGMVRSILKRVNSKASDTKRIASFKIFPAELYLVNFFLYDYHQLNCPPYIF